jgi:UDP-N-acetylglucosamine 4-epimerase
MNIIVTGHKGFIGSNLIKLLEKEHTVFGLDIADEASPYDVGDKLSFGAFACRHFLNTDAKCDAIVHLAAIGNIQRCIDMPEETWNSNVVGFENLIDIAKAIECKRIIYASSSSVYGGHSNVTRKIPSLVPIPMSYYAATKAINEHMAKAAQMAFGIQFTGLRLFNVIGPGQKLRSGYGAIIPKVIESIQTGKELPLYNMGENRRAYTPVNHVCKVIRELLSHDTLDAIYNVGSRHTFSTSQIVDTVETHLMKRANRVLKDKRSFEPVESVPGDLDSWTNFVDSADVIEAIRQACREPWPVVKPEDC